MHAHVGEEIGNKLTSEGGREGGARVIPRSSTTSGARLDNEASKHSPSLCLRPECHGGSAILPLSPPPHTHSQSSTSSSQWFGKTAGWTPGWLCMHESKNKNHSEDYFDCSKSEKISPGLSQAHVLFFLLLGEPLFFLSVWVCFACTPDPAS